MRQVLSIHFTFKRWYGFTLVFYTLGSSLFALLVLWFLISDLEALIVLPWLVLKGSVFLKLAGERVCVCVRARARSVFMTFVVKFCAFFLYPQCARHWGWNEQDLTQRWVFFHRFRLGDLGNIRKENLQKWIRAHIKRILRLSWPPAGLLRVVGTRELLAFVCPGFGL